LQQNSPAGQQPNNYQKATYQVRPGNEDHHPVGPVGNQAALYQFFKCLCIYQEKDAFKEETNA
jgi:hypothetical protein